MLIPKDISEGIIIRECGMLYADDMAATVFSDAIERHISNIIRSILPQPSSSSSPSQPDEVSEEFLLRELEMDDAPSINLTTPDVIASIRDSIS